MSLMNATDIAKEIGTGWVVVEITAQSGTTVTTAEDMTGAIDDDHAMYWALKSRMHDEW